MELPLGMECNGMNNGSGTKFMSVLLVATVYSCNCRSGYQTVERIQGSWYLLYHLSQLFNIKFNTHSICGPLPALLALLAAAGVPVEPYGLVESNCII